MKRLIGLTLIAMLSAAAPAMARASSDPSIWPRACVPLRWRYPTHRVLRPRCGHWRKWNGST